jgi:ubiquinone/menaquinone biosynthesis C-methylase UbiE
MNPEERARLTQNSLGEKIIHEEWARRHLNRDLDLFYDTAFRRIVELLEARPATTILDAGCGYGFHAVRLARLGLQVTGLDISEVTLDEARKRIDQEGLSDRIELLRADLLALPYPDNSFDFVNCWGVLMHIPEPEHALAELLRVLRPGGRLAMSENNLHSIHAQIYKWSGPLVRRLLRLPSRQSHWSQRGREEWESRTGGGLFIRQTNMKWLTQHLNHLGATLIAREAGQFTEIHVVIPWRSVQRLVYTWNYWWFTSVRHPGPAFGNILIFEKPNPKASS